MLASKVLACAGDVFAVLCGSALAVALFTVLANWNEPVWGAELCGLVRTTKLCSNLVRTLTLAASRRSCNRAWRGGDWKPSDGGGSGARTTHDCGMPRCIRCPGQCGGRLESAISSPPASRTVAVSAAPEGVAGASLLGDLTRSAWRPTRAD